MRKPLFLNLAFIVALSLGASLSCAQGGEHFISDASYRKSVKSTLKSRLKTARLSTFYNPSKGLSTSEKEALEFLYAYMPVGDFTDYPTSFYEENVKASMLAREQMPWGKTVPELFFRHFVLPLRTNNEPLDSARVVFYKELKPRVENLSMKEAILEVNHWCHEKVTYQPSDARTSAPLATVKTSLGRCGEESTFTVAALRSVGIPARQVYTPRWAHTESNHAWVEAWADGEWYFIGACEPEEVLNLGWFNAPASRAMLTHTKAFGDYRGEEEVVLSTPNYTEINLIGNYAKTGRVDFTVVDKDGAPVPGARVDFCIYNSSSFFPAVSKYTDAKGKTFLTAGLGDLLVWAAKGDDYGFSKVNFATDKDVVLTLDSPKGAPVSATLMHIVPPVEDVKLPVVTPEQKAENARKGAREDSLRKAYMATFFSPEKGDEFVAQHGLPAVAGALLVGSSGNHPVITSFLAEAQDKERAVAVLRTLSMKDLHDVTSEVLWDSYDNKESIIAQRIEMEFLTPYKSYFLNNIPEDLKTAFAGGGDPLKGVPAIYGWILKNVTVDDNPLFWDIPISPKGVWEGRYANPRSRNILFIALCRTFGFEARNDRMSGKMMYKVTKGDPAAAATGIMMGMNTGFGQREERPGDWRIVDFEAGTEVEAAPTGTVKLSYTQVGDIEMPRPGQHYSVSRISGGELHSYYIPMGFGGGGRRRGGPDGGAAARPGEGRGHQPGQRPPGRGVQVAEGDYLMCSGNRLSDGSTPVTVTLFHVTAGEELDLPLSIEILPEDVKVVGKVDPSALHYYPTKDKPGQSAVLSAQTGEGDYVAAILEVGLEPTNHVLRDIAEERAALEAWGRPIVLLCTSEAQMQRLQSELAAGRYGTLPSTVKFGIDTGEVLAAATGKLGLDDSRLPHVFVGNTKGDVYFTSQGYTIGMGTKIVALSKKL